MHIMYFIIIIIIDFQLKIIKFKFYKKIYKKLKIKY